MNTATRDLESADASLEFTSGDVDVLQTLGLLRYGTGDPAYRSHAGAVWRASYTPDGPGALRISIADRSVRAVGWGPGAGYLVASAPDMCGISDDVDGFDPDRHPTVASLHRRWPGVRFPRTGLLFESLVPAILSQKITGKEAFGSWRALLNRFGQALDHPGPERLRVPPAAATVRRIADWEWHQLGVDRAHRDTVRRAATLAASLERFASGSPEEAVRALSTVHGVGIWTASETVQRAMAGADLPSFGDYHIPGQVGLALCGAPVDDDGMAGLLEPFRPHRARVVRLIELARIGPQRRGPRRTVPDYRDM